MLCLPIYVRFVPKADIVIELLGEQVREGVRRTLGALKLHSRHRQTFHDLD